jgi:hypothetical protein
MITPEQNQGQIVQTSYSELPIGGWGYRKVLDQSEEPGSPEREKWARVWVGGRGWDCGPMSGWKSENWIPCVPVS